MVAIPLPDTQMITDVWPPSSSFVAFLATVPGNMKTVPSLCSLTFCCPCLES